MSATARNLAICPDPDASQRRAFAIRLQEIEDNPLTAEDLALFEMFDRRGLTAEQRIAYIAAEARKLAAG